MNKLLLTGALVALLAVSACDNGGNDAPAGGAGGEVPETIEVPVPQGVQDALRQLQDAATMTEAEKQEAVAEARRMAEDAARSAGFNDERIRQAGDAAENAARQALGVQ